MPSETTNFPRESTLREAVNALNMIAIAQAGSMEGATSWKGIQQIVRQGLGPKAYPVGSQIVAHHAVYGEIVFDVLAHDHHKAPGNAGARTMTIGMHRCINGMQIDNAEALYYCAKGLSAGTYHFKLPDGYDTSFGGGKSIQFALTKSVPDGGVVMFPWANLTMSTETNVSTYKSRESTEVIETVSVGEGTDGTDLGIADGTAEFMNQIRRSRYGSNNWRESAARQWLNSTDSANAWWHPQTIFDRPPSYANEPGFLAGFGLDFLAAVGQVDVTTARNSTYEEGNAIDGSYETRDKLFLPSMTEVGFGKNGQITEGSVMGYYDGATSIDRIKYDIRRESIARYLWLRSPRQVDSNGVRNITPKGEMSSSGAYGGDALAAACVIY